MAGSRSNKMNASSDDSRAPENGIIGMEGQDITAVPQIVIDSNLLVPATTSRSSSFSGRSSPTQSAYISSGGPTPNFSPLSDPYPSDGLEDLDDVENDLRSTLDPASGAVVDSPDEPSGTCQDLLLDSLKGYRNIREGKGFFPNSTFTTLIDETVVGRELRRSYDLRRLGSANIDRLAETICGDISYKKIFALLVLVDKLPHIGDFIRENVSDSTLPLCKVPRPGSNLFGLARRQTPSEPLNCFSSWGSISIRIFEEWQWTTLAPTFEKGQRGDVKHIVLGHQHPLPFTEDSRLDSDVRIQQGGHSTVFKVEIHPDHHDFNRYVGTANACNSFAVKFLSSRERVRFDQEVDMLVTFSGDSHNHLISLLATYQQGDEFYLIFPWAGGDLQSFWRDINPTPNMDRQTVAWVADQCYGIARGLAEIHKHETGYVRGSGDNPFAPKQLINRPRSGSLRLFGRHGDIKPQNVLWFNTNETDDSGILKITDLGLAEFKTSIDKIYKTSARVSMTALYRPPESDIKNGQVGQSHDIWALGCLYLEMMAWLLGGWTLVQEFEQLRVAEKTVAYFHGPTEGTFFKVKSISDDGTSVVVVKPTVTNFIARLRGLPACTDYTRKFLDLIRDEMLVIKPIDKAKKGRISAFALAGRLGAMRKLCI